MYPKFIKIKDMSDAQLNLMADTLASSIYKSQKEIIKEQLKEIRKNG